MPFSRAVSCLPCGKSLITRESGAVPLGSCTSHANYCSSSQVLQYDLLAGFFGPPVASSTRGSCSVCCLGPMWIYSWHVACLLQPCRTKASQLRSLQNEEYLLPCFLSWCHVLLVRQDASFQLPSGMSKRPPTHPRKNGPQDASMRLHDLWA